MAGQVAEELTAKDVIKAHARDELGIDLDEMSNPLQVSRGMLASGHKGEIVFLPELVYSNDALRVYSCIVVRTCALIFPSSISRFVHYVARPQLCRAHSACACYARLSMAYKQASMETCGMQAAGASAAAFCVGAGIPLLAAAFIHSYVWRLVSLVGLSMLLFMCGNALQ